ncbi:MAG: sulfatase-like hydrolase/transferase [Bacteroidales bacterium]|nr:sulfatase-like hydrolase/transferase [Bacteroidales bacterium]
MKIILSLTKQFVFWLMFFAIIRIIYFIYNINFVLVEDISFWEAVASFYYALNLDIATACYILVIPFLILLIQSFYSPVWINNINRIYTLVIISLFSLITTAELGVYEEWKTKLHYKALTQATHPSEIYNSAETHIFFLLIGILLIQVFVSFYLYRKFFFDKIVKIKRNIIFSILFFLIMPFFLVISMRGGLQEIPINQSQSYYSKHNILNLAAVNSGFNLYISVFENLKNFGENPFKYFDDEIAENIVNKIYETPKDTTIRILKNKNPNIVFLIMESWSADLIESLGADPGITPEFHKLEKEGVLFTNIYSPGSRSEQGMASIFSGFPSHPISAITVQPDKFVGLSSLTHIFNDKGYSSSFYFGGQLIYGNIKSYIIYNKFDRITEGCNFNSDIPKGKLTVHDQYVFNRMLNELNEDKEPFFSALFTSSTHSPFDMPMKIKHFRDDNFNLYLNSAWYTDSCIGDFMLKAKRQAWFDNTLFIIVADHSHHSYKHYPYHSKEYHKIPLLFCGNVIKEEFRGTTIDKLGVQTDIATTLLKQLNIDDSEFYRSKNLLNPYSPDFAYIAFEEGIGWVRPAGDFFYDNRFDHYYHIHLDPAIQDSVIKEGKAFLQIIFKEYMEY